MQKLYVSLLMSNDISRQILEQATDTYPELDTIRVHIAQDCTGKTTCL